LRHSIVDGSPLSSGSSFSLAGVAGFFLCSRVSPGEGYTCNKHRRPEPSECVGSRVPPASLMASGHEMPFGDPAAAGADASCWPMKPRSLGIKGTSVPRRGSRDDGPGELGQKKRIVFMFAQPWEHPGSRAALEVVRVWGIRLSPARLFPSSLDVRRRRFPDGYWGEYIGFPARRPRRTNRTKSPMAGITLAAIEQRLQMRNRAGKLKRGDRRLVDRGRRRERWKGGPALSSRPAVERRSVPEIRGAGQNPPARPRFTSPRNIRQAGGQGTAA